eukprot:tig00000849_g4771.t1
MLSNFEFSILPEEDAFHQGRGVYIHRSPSREPSGNALPLQELQRATIFISRLRVVIVYEVPDDELFVGRRVWSIPLDCIDEEELVTSGQRPFLRLRSHAASAPGYFEVICAIPDRALAVQGMIYTSFVILGRLFESRFPATLETVEVEEGEAAAPGPSSGAGARTPSPRPAPRGGSPWPDEGASPREKKPRSSASPAPSAFPAIRSATGSPRASPTHAHAATARPASPSPASPSPASLPLELRPAPAPAPTPAPVDPLYCVKVPVVDVATGELCVASRTFERRRAAFVDEATGQVYLAEEQRPAPLRAPRQLPHLAASRLAERGMRQLSDLCALYSASRA